MNKPPPKPDTLAIPVGPPEMHRTLYRPNKSQAKWNAEVKEKLAAGMSFDEAWIAAGGKIIDVPQTRAEALKDIGA